MHGQPHFRNSVFYTLSAVAAVVLLVLLAAIPIQSQNPVPPTAREAAASPAFASKLHPAAQPKTNQMPAPARGRNGLASQQGQVIYENGPVNGTTDAWTINFGFVVSDTFVPNGSVTGFDFYVWEFPGDKLTSVDWSITSAPNSGTVYGSGTVSGANLTDTFISTNQYGYNIDVISASGLNVNAAGTLWLNLANASVPTGDPVYWDENSGAGCHSPGCPSQAAESLIGTIPSEAFDITGGGSGCFQPSSPDYGQKLQILHSFTQDEVGSGYPSRVTYPVYGTTSGGGDHGFGLAYSLPGNGMFTPLYSFMGGDNGAEPSPVIAGPDRALYGTMGSGGIHGCGVVYTLRPSPVACLTSKCDWVEIVIYSFAGNSDACSPNGNLAFDLAGNLYGTAYSGPYSNNNGAVYQLTPSNGGWTEKVIYSFSGGNDGGGPSSLVVGDDGSLYGTTYSGGQYGAGTVFQLTPAGGDWILNTLHSFTGFNGDGFLPDQLFQDHGGNLWGHSVQSGYQDNIFTLSRSNGGWVFSTLWQTPLGEGLTGLAGIRQYEEGWGSVVGGPCLGQECSPASEPAGGPYFYFVHCLLGQGCYQLFSGQGTFPGGVTAVDAAGDMYGITYTCGAFNHGTVWRWGY
jgi:uncharacterized repeat protein (TIGR03803 family)